MAELLATIIVLYIAYWLIIAVCYHISNLWHSFLGIFKPTRRPENLWSLPMYQGGQSMRNNEDYWYSADRKG